MRRTPLLFHVLFAGFVLAMTALTARALSSSDFANPDNPATAAPPPRVQTSANQPKPNGRQLIQTPGGGVSLRDEVIPSIGINLSGKMDVALAIGKESFGDGASFTGTVNYADFENELRQWFNIPGNPPGDPIGTYPPGYYLTVPTHYHTPNDALWNWAKNKYGPDAPMLPNRDLYIDASQMQTLSMSEEFPWWEYDHVHPVGAAKTDHTNHIYHEFTNQSGGSTYTQSYLTNHMILSDLGATLQFQGYHYAGLSDFAYLPNDQPTRKIIEFGLQEAGAAHAFGGNGFFFNCHINDGIYGDATTPQLMNGYRIYFRYDDYTGKDMYIFKFKNVNTKTLHQSGNFPAGTGTFSYAGGSWTCVAFSTLYKVGTTQDISRRIKIEIDPDYVRIWFNAAVNNLTIVNTAFADYPGTFGVDPDNYIVKATNVSSTGWQLYNSTTTDSSIPGSIKLDQSYISGYGFGPFAVYNSHSCDQKTIFTIKNLTMSMGSVRKLHEVVADPHWHDNTKRVLVNLNLQEIEDFTTPAMMGDLLSRVINDNIYYIGWCSDQNLPESQQFANASNPVGTLINIADAGNYTGSDPVSPASRGLQLEKMAQAIYDVWYTSNVDNRVLVTDDVNFTVEPAASGANTADFDWPDGKWKFIHRTPTELGWAVNPADPDNATTHPLNNQRMSNLDIDFTYPGEYDVYYRDVKIKTITAHRKPVAQFNANMANLAAPVFINTSYDPDDYDPVPNADGSYNSNGIDPAKTQWKWTDLTASQSGPGTPSTLEADHVYLIELTVEDKWGATATAAKTLMPSSSAAKEPPMALFELGPVTVIRGLLGQNISILDQSYDNYGRDFLYTWNSSSTTLLNQLGFNSAGTGTGLYSVPPTLAAGEYKVDLVVTTDDADHQASLLASRTFWVVEDLTPPTATVDKAAPATFIGYTTITLTFADVPVYDTPSGQNVMSGFKGQWVHVSPTQISNPSLISGSDWGDVSTVNNRAVSLPVGDSYVYWKADDQVGNTAYGEFGKYIVNPFPTPVTLTPDPALSVVYGGSDVLLTAKLENSKNPYAAGTIEFVMDGTSLGFADIIRGADGAAPEIYTAYAMFNATPDRAALSTPPANPLMDFTALFSGDEIHGPGSGIISYTVDPNPDAEIDITLTLGVGANSKIYDGTGISLPNVEVTYPKGGGFSTDFAIDYRGNEYGDITTPYAPQSSSPINVGDYKATAWTTSPNYVTQYDDVDFFITPRVVTVQVTPQSAPVQNGDPVTFTATIGNLCDAPAGTVDFYLDGILAPSGTGMPIGPYSSGTATATWTWPSADGGSHDIMAVFVPAAHSNYAANSHTISGYNVAKTTQLPLYFYYDNSPSTQVPDEDAGDTYTGQTLATGLVYGGPDFKVLAKGGSGSGMITYELVSQSPYGGTACVDFNPLSRVVKIKGAGTLYVKATKAGDIQYNAVDTVLLVKIARAPGNVTVNVDDVNYLEPLNPVITNLSGGALTYSYSGVLVNSTPYGPTSTPPTQAGSYTLTVTAAQTANYLTASGSDAFAILQLPQTIVLNNNRDTTLWTTQTAPFTLPVTGGRSTGGLTWNSTIPAVATVAPVGAITLQPGLMPPAPPTATDITVQKAGDNNYTASNLALITLNVVYQPTNVDVGLDALPPDFADATYEWMLTATGLPPFSWNVSNLPSGMTITPSGPNGEYLTISGTPTEVFEGDLAITVTNGGSIPQVVNVPMTVYPAPTASTDNAVYVEPDVDMVVDYPLLMDRNLTGMVTVNGRLAGGYWLSDGEFVIPPPRDGYDYETTYTVVISGLKDAKGAIIHYQQVFTFRTGQRPPLPLIPREVVILPLPEGVTSDLAPEVEHIVLSGDDFIFTLTVPSESEPVIATNRIVGGVIEKLKGEQIDDTDAYRFVIRKVRQNVEISVTLEPRSVGNEVIGDQTKIWSHDNKLHVETSHAGVLSAYTLTGELCLQQTVVGSAKFTLPRGVYIAKMHGRAYKVIIH